MSKITANAATKSRISSVFTNIYPSPLPLRPSDFFSLDRFDQCTFSQLKTGMSSISLDTLFLFGKATSANCPSCHLIPDSIRHLLSDCPVTYRSRSRVFSTSDFNYIMSDSAGKVLAFLRELGRVAGSHNRPAAGWSSPEDQLPGVGEREK